MTGIAVVIMLCVYGWAMASSHQQDARLRGLLAGVGSMLQSTTVQDARWVTGWRGVIATRYHLTTRGRGKHSQRWTEVSAEIPAAYPLAINLRVHGGLDAWNIERGAMVDVAFGDPAFDARFLVEAAPADVIRALLAEEQRAALMRIDGNFELTDSWLDGHRVLKLSFFGWSEDLGKAQYVLDMLVRIAERVRAAYGTVEAAMAPSLVGDAYRPMYDDGPRVQAAQAREAEVAVVATLQRERDRNSARLATVLVVGFAVVAAIVLVLDHV